MWCIYELTPAPWGDAHRYVIGLETEADAQQVLEVFEKVNLAFHYYKIIYMRK